MRYSRRSTTYVSIMLFVLAPPCLAADWPMWGYDAGHTATSPERLSSQLYLQWVRTLPPPKSAWDWTQYRLHFDASYEPVVMGDTLFVPSMGRDSLTAYDLTTGQERWRFYADGPIRLAPAAAHGKVYFVADDGCLYCLDATDGSLCFRFHAAPTARKVLGNERMISTWPGRGGPVLFDGTVYFAAGVWPFMGIFLYALNAETGDVLWENSGSGAMYILQPHNSPAFAGVAPQGHMTVLGDTLLVSAGRSVPAAFDRHTGSFLYFHTNTKKGHHAVQARKEWFLNDGTIYRVTDGKALAEVPGTVLTQDALIGMKSPGELVVQALRLEEKIVTKTDKRGKEIQETVYSFPELWHGKVEPPLERLHLCAGSRLYGSTKNGVVAAIELPQGGTDLQVAWQTQVDGEPYSMLAANGRLIVVTREGRIYCFGAQPVPNVSVFDPPQEAPSSNEEWAAAARDILAATGVQEGYGLVVGMGTGHLAEALARQSNLCLIGLEADSTRVAALRRHFDDSGLYGERVAILPGELASAQLPPYFASLVVSEEAATLSQQDVPGLFHCLRPYGGVVCVSESVVTRLGLASWVGRDELANAELREAGHLRLLVREGPLPGAGSWTHQYGDVGNTVFSSDRLVKAPLGLLWFGGPSFMDVLPRHGHGPSPQVIGGRLFIEGPNCLSARDVYTGRELWKRELEDLNTFGAYYDETFNPDPFDRTYNQVHIPGANELGANFVATADEVYVITGRQCTVLSAATGEILRQISLPPEGAERSPHWGYIGVWEDLLIAAVSPLHLSESEYVHDAPFAAGSKNLVVIERHTGRKLWARPAVYDFRHNAIVAGNNKLFCIDGMSPARLDLLRRRGIEPQSRPQLLALDIRTGEVIWQTTDNVFGTWLGYSAEYDVLVQGGSRSNDRAADEVGSGMVAYRGTDGQVLWQNQDEYLGPPILHHDRVITQVAYGTLEAGPAGAYHLLTGEKVLRTHPLSGQTVPWSWLRYYGCNTAIASEYLLTFRSAAASFVDLTTGQGTCSVGGFKSGCTSNLIAADGVLNAPDYTRTCICSYQNQSSLALIHDPTAEQWSFDYYPPPSQPTAVTRLGLNLGAPGNRFSDEGTLFLEFPSVGGPSPDVPVRVEGDNIRWYRRHTSLFAGDWPWIGASGLEGTATFIIRPFLQPSEPPVKVPALERNAFTLEADWPAEIAGQFPTPQPYTVRLYFAEPANVPAGRRVFDVVVQGTVVLPNLDIVAAAGASRRTIVKEVKRVAITDDLIISLQPCSTSEFPPILCGLELIAETQ